MGNVKIAYLVAARECVLIYLLCASRVLPIQECDAPQNHTHAQCGPTHNRGGHSQVDDTTCDNTLSHTVYMAMLSTSCCTPVHERDAAWALKL